MPHKLLDDVNLLNLYAQAIHPVVGSKHKLLQPDQQFKIQVGSVELSVRYDGPAFGGTEEVFTVMVPSSSIMTFPNQKTLAVELLKAVGLALRESSVSKQVLQIWLRSPATLELLWQRLMELEAQDTAADKVATQLAELI